MRSFLKTKCSTLFATLIAVLTIVGCDPLNLHTPHPTDERLIQQFHKCEADYNKLVTMSNEDPKVIRIAYDFTRLEDNGRGLATSRSLVSRHNVGMNIETCSPKLGLPVGIERAEQKEGVFVYLPVSTKGLGNGHGSSKGYAFLERQLTPLLDSLDDKSVKAYYEREKPERRVTLYRRISGNWYLYRD